MTLKARFGKHPKRNDRSYRTLQLSKYFAGLPAAPEFTSNLNRVLTATKTTVAQLFPMDGNDLYGNCTIAALAHLITMIYGFIGRTVIPTRAQAIALYLQLTGGQDTGLDMLTVLNYIRQNGWLGEKPVLAFAEVDIANNYLVQQSINAFGFNYTGFQVPRGCMAQFDAGGPWTRGPLTQDGHAVALVDYARIHGLKALSWGGQVMGTWPWFDECVDESYVIVPQEAATPGYIPGLDIEHLLADLKEVTA